MLFSPPAGAPPLTQGRLDRAASGGGKAFIPPPPAFAGPPPPEGETREFVFYNRRYLYETVFR